MPTPTVALAWQPSGLAGYAALICKHIESEEEFDLIERTIDPGQEPYAIVDGREVESLFVCPDCEIALLSQMPIEWRGCIWPEEEG